MKMGISDKGFERLASLKKTAQGVRVTLSALNETDDPKSFGGKLLSDDGRNQLWLFGDQYANRTEYEEDTADGSTILNYEWDTDLAGWNPDNYEMEPVED